MQVHRVVPEATPNRKVPAGRGHHGPVLPPTPSIRGRRTCPLVCPVPSRCKQLSKVPRHARPRLSQHELDIADTERRARAGSGCEGARRRAANHDRHVHGRLMTRRTRPGGVAYRSGQTGAARGAPGGRRYRHRLSRAPRATHAIRLGGVRVRAVWRVRTPADCAVGAKAVARGVWPAGAGRVASLASAARVSA